MYENGEGVDEDPAEAAHWYRMAANRGDTDAQDSLARLYERGAGVPQDYLLAHMWYNLAASQGDQDAQHARERIASDMTRAEVLQARRMARDWRPDR